MQRGMNALQSSEAKGKPPLLCRIFLLCLLYEGIISFGKKHWYSSV